MGQTAGDADRDPRRGGRPRRRRRGARGAPRRARRAADRGHGLGRRTAHRAGGAARRASLDRAFRVHRELSRAARRHPGALSRALPAHAAGSRADRAQPGRRAGERAVLRATRRPRRARGDAGRHPAPAAPRPHARRGRRRSCGGGHPRRPGGRGHRAGRLVHRRDGDRRAAGPDRLRARDRHRVAGDDRRAACPVAREPGVDPGADVVLRARPPRRRGSHHCATGGLRALARAPDLARARPQDGRSRRAAPRAQSRRRPGRHGLRPRRRRGRSRAVDVPPDRGARELRARRLLQRHHDRQLAAARLRDGRARTTRASCR